MRFITSTAWKLQAFTEGNLPEAIPESEYLCPSSGLQSNDQRRNWTDMQETAQWVGGMDIPRKLLEHLNLGGPSRDLSFNCLCNSLFVSLVNFSSIITKHPDLNLVFWFGA